MIRTSHKFTAICFIFSVFALILSPALMAQRSAPQRFPFDAADWTFEGEHTLEPYKGAESLLLQSGASASLPGVALKNGVIEYDVSFGRHRGFVYILFRIQDDKNYEEYYLRPHQSGNPDAMQYSPVFNGVSGWQLYYGENHSTAHHFKDDEWMHVKLVMADNRMEIYIDNMNIPVLDVFEMKRPAASGSVAFTTFLTPARYANVEIRVNESPEFAGPKKSAPERPQGVVKTWNVSSAFSNEALTTKLPDQLISGLKWQSLQSEYSGVVNLAQANTLTSDNNTVFAKFTVTSDRDQVKQLLFGYSDIVRIYANDKALYEGQHIFQSRDYRYLGTVGYFESVFLELKEGRNEVWFAVTENFGGWGAMARFDDPEGIRLE